MNNAKHYANLYNTDPSDETISHIARRFLEEVEELIRGRNARSNEAVLSILDEQDAKWKAFAWRAEGGINPDGFAVLVWEFLPEAYLAWQYRSSRKARGELL